MTCKEKLREQHSELDDKAFDDLVETSCPDGFGYFVDPDSCIPNEQKCDDCWNREIPEPKKGKKKKMTCKERLRNSHADMTDESFNTMIDSCCPDEFECFGHLEKPEYCSPFSEACDKCWDREYQKKSDVTDEPYGHPDPVGHPGTPGPISINPTIKDSGNRRQFESGAVRDMQEGKGRFDLVPLEVVSDLLGTKDIDHDPVVLDIATFMYDYDTCWLYAAIENFAEKAYDGCLYTMLLEVAKHFEDGAKKYSEGNWKKGIPVKCYIDSALRHYMKWCRGDKDEPHDRALVWNLMCCIWEREYGEEWRKSGGSAE